MRCFSGPGSTKSQGRTCELLTPIEAENADEFPADQNLHAYEDDDADPAYRKPFRESAAHLAVSFPRSCAFWSMFRFIKETYVWLVWIPLILIGLGIGMNFLAVTMNHGVMPVVLPPWGAIADKDKMHVAATAHSRFLFLCDWIQHYATGDVASPGDCLIRVGDFLKWPLVCMWVGFISRQVKGRANISFYGTFGSS
jgi:hypothetical protein